MSEIQYTNYIVPTVPVYAYRYYVGNHDDWRKGAKPIYKIEIAPVVAFGCGLDEDGYNVTAALILEEGGGFLIAAEDDASFLGCYHDKGLTIDYFADLITEKEKGR